MGVDAIGNDDDLSHIYLPYICFFPVKFSYYLSRPVPVPELFCKYPTRPEVKNLYPSDPDDELHHLVDRWLDPVVGFAKIHNLVKPMMMMITKMAMQTEKLLTNVKKLLQI